MKQSLRLESPADEPVKDSGEIKFVDQLLEGWSAWAHQGGTDQRATQTGDLWQIQTMIEASSHVLKLSDDGFVLIDQKIALLPAPLHDVVRIEYMASGPSKAKSKRLGLSYLAYRQRLHAAQWTLFASLLPVLDTLKSGR